MSEINTASFWDEEGMGTGPTSSHVSHFGPGGGETVGPYKILEIIGEGGFGSVYLAEQTEPVKRRVAVKLLRPGMDSASVIARFEAERQVLALMDHPGIATVLDAGETSLGRPYFVMEYVRGRPITEYCDGVSLGLRDRVQLMRRVCMAVHHAHQKGVIHRDIKPSNVLVAVSDGEAIPKVIDFGIAKAMSQSAIDSEAYTGMHQLLGTPTYMSPEQAGGASHEVDTRSDVYSLGAMMYELFTGTTPIRAEELRGLSIPQVHERIATVSVTSMPDRLLEETQTLSGVADRRSSDASTLGGELKGDLNWIVLRCLEKEASRRYESVAALDAELGRYLNHEVVLAGPPSRVYRLRKFLRRRRLEVAAGLAVTLALALGFVGTAVGYVRASDESSRLRETLDFFNSTLAGVTSESSAVPIWSDDPSLTLGEALARSQTGIDSRFAGEPELEANIRQLIGLAQLRGGEFIDAELQLSKAFELRETALGPSHERTLELLLPIVEARSKTGDAAGAMEAAHGVHERYVEALGEDAEATRAVALWNARWLASGFRFAEAERFFDLAVLEVAGTADLSDPITLSAVIERTATLVAEGELGRAESSLRAAKPQIDRLDSGADQIRTLFVRQFGQVLTLRGLADEACELLRARDGDALAATDRVRARLLAWSLAHADQGSESTAKFAALSKLEREQPGPPFRMIFLRLYRADALIRQGRFEQAAIESSSAIEQYDARGFPNDPDRLWGRMVEARAWAELGDVERARTALEDADELTALFPEYRLRVPELLYAQAKVLELEDRGEAAERRVRAAIASGRDVFGPGHWLVEEMETWRASLRSGADAPP